MKKLSIALALILCLVMVVFCFAACGKKKGDATTADQGTTPEATTAPKVTEPEATEPEATEHQHTQGTEYVIDTPATCGADGSKSYHCTECGDIIPGTEVVIPADPTLHVVNEWTIVAATVIKDGTQTGTCTNCNQLVEKTVAFVPNVYESTSAGSDWKIKKNLTDALDGEHFYPTEANPNGLDYYFEVDFLWNETITTNWIDGDGFRIEMVNADSTRDNLFLFVPKNDKWGSSDAKAPGGFDHYQPAALGNAERGAAVLSRPVDWNVSWWAKVLGAYGSVYSSDQWVQWIPNTVAHLPRFDGTTLDSFFWSDNTCGGTNGTYRFAMTAEPASRWVQMAYSDTRTHATYKAPGSRHHLVCVLDGLVVVAGQTNDTALATERFDKFRFTGRHSLQDGADLLPLGGAFAKSCPVMWDGHGAATPWEVTSDDADANGLPDTWEQYAVGNYSPESLPLTWDTAVKWKRPSDGARIDMTAGEAYRRDLVYGRLVASNDDGDLDIAMRADLRQTADEDYSGTPDWWDDLYGIYEAGPSATTDSDNDGLSNYAEYLASESFPFGLTLNPKRPMSDSKTLDYFLRIGSLYLGEMFTDHDHMEDWWERSTSTADPGVWDAQVDGSGNGWSNFAERRSFDDMSTWVQVGTETDTYTVTFDTGSNERSIFDVTNTATIADTEWFYPEYGWSKTHLEHYDGSVYGGGQWVDTATKVRYTLVGSKPIMGYGGVPIPKVELTVHYNGNLLDGGEIAPLVVKAYSGDDMLVPDAVFSNTVTRGVNKLTLHVPAQGRLREGRNHFVAYMLLSADGGSDGGKSGGSSGETQADSEYQPGQPFGVARDVDVGWNSARVEIELAETSPITPRLKLWEAESSDRVARFYETPVTNRFVAVDPAALPPNVRVRVVRQVVDGRPVWTVNTAAEILFDKTFTHEVRDFIHEGDFLADGKFDIDWDNLESGVYYNEVVETAGLEVTNMTYVVVVGDGDFTYLSDIDNVHTVYAHPYTVTRRFEVTHTPPTAVSENGDSVCRVAQPTFRWKIENEDPWASAYGTTYTAFKAVVKNSAGQTVYDSGYQRMPAADSSGVYSWTAPLYVDNQSPSGSHLVFENLKNYTWQVFTYNAKFKTDNVGTAPKALRMNVTEADRSSCGFDIDVCYAGPAANLASRIRVQAFTSPDFSGYPVSEAIVTNVARTALDASAGSRVHVRGLRPGTYFVRAYIDTDYDWSLDPWESWGYLSERDRAAVTGTKSIFNPSPVTVGPDMAAPAVRKLYIEDRDTDGDGFPDVWEAEQNGNAFVVDYIKPVTGDAELIAVNPDLSATLTKASQGYISTAATALSSASGFAMMSGLSLASAKTIMSAGVLPAAVVDGTVEIKSIAFDRESGEVVLGVGAETAPEGVDPTVASLYALSVARGAVVKVKVYRTETLAGEWTLVAEETLTVDPVGTEIRAPLSTAVDTASGFFKVEVESL